MTPDTRHKSFIVNVIKLLRPAQWLKNGFVFLPMFFAGSLTSGLAWWHSAIAFFTFCFAASAVYCLNDIVDAPADRMHPVKCRRPVAAGLIAVPQAIAVMLVCAAASIVLPLLLLSGPAVAWLAVGYLLLNVAYSLKLKQFAVVDVFIIATGFVLRVMAGGAACDIPLSPWIICMTFLITLFMAFAKRRDDVVIYERSGTLTRKNTVNYNLPFLDQAIGMLATITMVCYLMYCLSGEVMERLGSGHIYLTSIFVLAGLVRYLQLTIVMQQSGSPTRMLTTDRFLQVCVLGWLASFAAIIYL